MTIVIGAGLLGWIAGDMVVTDVITGEWVNDNASYLRWVMPVFLALSVVAVGKWLAARTKIKQAAMIDLADSANK